MSRHHLYRQSNDLEKRYRREPRQVTFRWKGKRSEPKRYQSNKNLHLSGATIRSLRVSKGRMMVRQGQEPLFHERNSLNKEIILCKCGSFTFTQISLQFPVCRCDFFRGKTPRQGYYCPNINLIYYPKLKLQLAIRITESTILPKNE